VRLQVGTQDRPVAGDVRRPGHHRPGISLTPSLAKALAALIEQGIVRKEATEFRVVNPFLVRWLLFKTP
jgi:hypothetical protein